jgi:parallel beta-helix repeat protein
VYLKRLLILIGVSLLIPTVLAGADMPTGIEVGNPPSSTCIAPTDGLKINSTQIFCTGTYYLDHGVKVQDAENILLNCNGSTLIGTGDNEVSFIGISLSNSNGVTIKDCKLQNYRVGIALFSSKHNQLLNNRFSYNQEAIWFAWGHNDNNLVMGNKFHNNDYDLIIHSSSFNVVKNNTFESSIEIGEHSQSGHSVSNKVYNNSFYDSAEVLNSNSQDQTFCFNGVGNNYYDDSTGPTCQYDLEDRVSVLEQLVQTIKDAICTVHSFDFCDGDIITTTTTTLGSQCHIRCQTWYDKSGVCKSSCGGGERYVGTTGCSVGNVCCCI